MTGRPGGATVAALVIVLLTACTRPAPSACGASAESAPVAGSATAPAVRSMPGEPMDTIDGGVDGTSEASVPEAARLVAEEFVRAWARPGLDAGTWLSGVRRYATPDYGARLASVDPANVPARAVTGAAVAVSSNAAVAVYDVPTDAGTVRVICISAVDGRWLVTTMLPAGSR